MSSTVLDPEPAAEKGPKTWRLGTLTYTTTGLVVLFCWLLAGDLAWSTKERSVMWVVQLLLKKFEASDTVMGVLLGGLPHALTLFLMPVVSYLSDHHRGRWGRRIPFLAYSTPFTALSIVGLAFSPEIGTWAHSVLGDSSPGLNNMVLVAFGFFWTVFEVSTIVANTVFFALINDVVPKAVLGRFYGLFRALGLGIGIGFNYWLFGLAESHFAWIFMGVGVIYAAGFTALCLKVKEGEYPPPEMPASVGLGVIAAVRSYGRECLTRGHYLWIYAAVALSWMAISAFNLFNVLFAKQIGLDLDAYGKCLAASFVISFVLSYFVGAAVDRFHPLRVSIATMGLFGVIALVGALMVKDAETFRVMLISGSVTSGLWMTASASLTMRLFPQAKFAQYDSARGLITSFGMMLVGPALGILLDLNGHDYRLVYYVGSGFAGLAVATSLVVHGKFLRLGGDEGYTAPE